MHHNPDHPSNPQQRSEFIRRLIQRTSQYLPMKDEHRDAIPRTIVQFWDDLQRLPHDIEECITSWKYWESKGFKHRLFDEGSAKEFISNSFGARHVRAFERCYHPAMQSDYFRLCYILVEGGAYVDADDICVDADIDWLFDDARLKAQPLCYDIRSASMVEPRVFLAPGANDLSWIFYFNNTPLIAGRKNPILEQALSQATLSLEMADQCSLPEIQETTGPGNLTKVIFDVGMALPSFDGVDNFLKVLPNWDDTAISKWPLSYREDARNWRLSNQKRFNPKSLTVSL